jgi:histidinol-phosphate aminotransferase
VSDKLVSERIERIAPYEPGKPLDELHRELGAAWPKEGAIKLASNENPLGPSPKAVHAAQKALESAHLYPDGGSFYLREALAHKLSVDAKQIVCGSGSNELIDLCVQTFCEPDEEVLAPAVSFACYKLSSEAHRRPFRETPNGAGFAYDLDALAAAVTPRTKLVFLANPNNPTGVYANKEQFERLLRALPERVVLVLDEAYFEYVRASDYPNGVSLVRERARERLIVLRTFSKAYGLAGLRAGYAVGAATVIDYLHRVRLAFNVSAIAQAAARAALGDAEHLERVRANNASELPRLESELRALGLAVTPSQANFVLAEVGREARPIYEALLHRGVIVRGMGLYGLPQHLRITVGTPSENRRLIEALKAVL